MKFFVVPFDKISLFYIICEYVTTIFLRKSISFYTASNNKIKTIKVNLTRKKISPQQLLLTRNITIITETIKQ